MLDQTVLLVRLSSQSVSIDAPTWLRDSVVDLTASHEAGNLEHCRRYALAEAA